MGKVSQNMKGLLCTLGRQTEWINFTPGEVIPAPLLQSSREEKSGPFCIILGPHFLVRDPVLLLISSVT